MKQLSVYGLALLLVIGTSVALAGDRNRHHRSHGDGHSRHHYKVEKRHHGYDRHHYYRKRDYQRHYYRPHHYGSRHYWGYAPRYYGPRYYYPSYLGAALVGSALTYSLYHTHSGALCYDRHETGTTYSSPASEVVGCHRIEQLPDGSERRVDVPLSECY